MDKSFFKNNRNALREAISNGVVLLSAHTNMQLGNDMSFTFFQESNFFWLTGINEANWRVILEGDESWLVAPDTSESRRLFDGGLSWDEAKKVSGVNAVISLEEADTLLVQLAQKHSTVYTLGKDPHEARYDFVVNPAPTILRKELKKSFNKVKDCRLELTRLRAIKQPEEIAAIKKAIALTVGAFKGVKKNLNSYEYEYQVEADLSHHFRRTGAKGHAYDPIVAGGKNACTLHYIDNQDKIEKNGLLLLDIGARVYGYAADITRTYQVGQATKRQQQVHAAVESAHKEIISLLKPGLRVAEYHEKVDKIMKEKLTELGSLEKPSDYRKYFPHAISHGLGIDVHDALGQPTEFLEGMVLTVEPGIYIPEAGIGVRIEDDILITKNGHENLSAALPTSL